MNHWLIKSEPQVYAWSQLVRDGHTCWDGVRNFQARNYLNAMRVHDTLLYYHSGDERMIVGLATVIKEAYPDPNDPAWRAVDIQPLRALKRAVTLKELKAHTRLRSMALIKQPRLSVSPVTTEAFELILSL